MSYQASRAAGPGLCNAFVIAQQSYGRQEGAFRHPRQRTEMFFLRRDKRPQFVRLLSADPCTKRFKQEPSVLGVDFTGSLSEAWWAAALLQVMPGLSGNRKGRGRYLVLP